MSSKEKSLSKGGIYYLIYNLLNIAFPFITGIYVSHVLLPDNIGAVEVARNLAQYFVILSFLGIPTYGMREIAKNRDDFNERSKVFSELFIINLVSTIIFLSIYLFLICIIDSYRSELCLYLIVGLSIALNIVDISWLYNGLEEFKFISLRNLAFKSLVFLLLIVFVKTNTDYLKYALISVVGVAGNGILNMVYAPRYAKFTMKQLNLKRHMRSIMFLVAVNLAIEIYSLVDVTMMNFLSSKDSIAFYKYGHTIEKMLLQVVNTFTMVLVPRISFNYKQSNYNEFNRLISKAFKLIVITALPMIIGILFTSDFLLVIIYGPLYIRSSYILKIFSSLLLISPIGYLLGSRVLLASGHENKMLIAVGAGAIVNVIGNAFLIPIYAEFGAATASVVSEVVVMIVYVHLGQKYFRLCKVKSSIIKVFFATILMSVYLFLVSLIQISELKIFIMQFFGSMIIYYLLLILLREETVCLYTKQVITLCKHRLALRK